jgi:glycosyltransferase involved in cell wall biosynthesis
MGNITRTPVARREEPGNRSQNGRAPRVSIGLPVYNGEEFLADAIESALGQVYTDFELIISDNASTDATQAICEAYAARDPRVRYYRNEINIGAARNFNRVFHLSAGEYFKWLCHDDTFGPEFLGKAVAVLDADPGVVLCCSLSQEMNRRGKADDKKIMQPKVDSPHPAKRFRELLHLSSWYPFYGLVRRRVLANTPLIGSYAGGDDVLLAALALWGRFYTIPEVHAWFRRHPARSVIALRGPYRKAAFLDPNNAGRFIFPRWRRLGEYIRVVAHAPLSPVERVQAYGYLAIHFRWRSLIKDVLHALAEAPGRLQRLRLAAGQTTNSSITQ